MAYLYDEYERDYWVYQPGFVRSRQIFRGPRDSFRINQEIQQTLFDLNRINVQYDDTLSLYDDYVELLEDGTEALDDLEVNWQDDDVEEGVELLGLKDLNMLLEKIRDRIEVLEYYREIGDEV